jgi:hypothetical protein
MRAVFEELAGGMAVASACSKHRITESLFWVVLDENPDLQEQYARARIRQAHRDADLVTETAFDLDLPPDEKRVRIDALKWTAGKRAPKVYGERIAVDVEKPVTPEEVAGEHQALIDGLARLGFKRG